MEELKKNIENILNQFAREELGNRLSQFAWITFRNLILIEIDKTNQPKKEPEKKDV